MSGTSLGAFQLLGLLRVLAPSLGLLVSQFLSRTRTRWSGTSSRSSRSSSSRSSSSRSSLSRSSFCVCSTKQRQHDTHQERPAQSNVHARPRDARVESAQANNRPPVSGPPCRQAANRPMSKKACMSCTLVRLRACVQHMQQSA